MALIKITKINAGAPGTKSYNGQPFEELTMEFTHDIGLTKYSAWLHSARVGDTFNIGKKILKSLCKSDQTAFEFEVLNPKYANHHVGSDVYPFEILEWKSESCIIARRMNTSGYYGVDGEYCDNYESDERNPTVVLRLHKNGGFYEAGTNYCPYILDESPYFYPDPSF